MSVKVKEFVADVVTRYPGDALRFEFPRGAEIEMQFDPADARLPIMLNTNGYWFSPKQLRKVAKILNATADAVEARNQLKD